MPISALERADVALVRAGGRVPADGVIVDGEAELADAGSTRSVEVTMLDNRFEPSTITVGRGENVTFVFHNTGSVVHDAYVGDAGAQAMYETDMMGGGAGHGAHGGAANSDVTVEPGKTGMLTHTFDQAGAVEIGCHEPGHYAGGMKMAVAVT